MKLELETTIYAVTTLNGDLLVETKHVSEPATRLDLPARFIRSINFGMPRDQAEQLFVGRKVRIMVEILDK